MESKYSLDYYRTVLNNLKSAKVKEVLQEKKLDWKDDYILANLVNLEGLLPWFNENRLQLAVFLSTIERVEIRLHCLEANDELKKIREK